MGPADQITLPEHAMDELARRVGAVLRGDHDGRGLRIGLACALFNGGVTWRLLQGAMAGLERCGVDRRDVVVTWVPGAFELPLAARALVTARSVDAVVCLGAVIRGETGHYDLVAGGCATGIQQVQLDTGVPVVFGVLTTENLDQALARSEVGEPTPGGPGVSTAVEPGDDPGGPGDNKGHESAVTAVEMVRLLASSPMLAARDADRRTVGVTPAR
ncbi:MAG TPA: 6,7-dimethyl-8-ribityllumazine synthase [Acidimicrobiales bacterium]|jgi:6,7-dimethyl-8-ribityllumazine synthase